MKVGGRDAEMSTLKQELQRALARADAAERRVARYQIAFCRFQSLIGDLCSADTYISTEAHRFNRSKE